VKGDAGEMIPNSLTKPVLLVIERNIHEYNISAESTTNLQKAVFRLSKTPTKPPPQQLPKISNLYPNTPYVHLHGLHKRKRKMDLAIVA
jgi:hypothetical protein